jgi:ABC-2 type transport system permease protein
MASVYGAVAAMTPKLFLAYRAWAWVELLSQILFMAILVFFWRAVYAASGGTLGGLSVAQTVNYIVIAQILAPLVENRLVFDMGWRLREGQVAIDLLRPADFQMRFYVDALTSLMLYAALKLPLVVLGVLAFGLRLPTDPLAWIGFFVALVLGHAVVFFFDWLFACLAFYTTETWGLSVMRVAMGTFFSGALLPLSIMPHALRVVAEALPFAQTIYVPAALLSGITAPGDAPRVWLVQLAWLIGLVVTSRLFFRVAVRKITVQGG